MSRDTIKFNDTCIGLYGTNSQVKKAKDILSRIKLTGVEDKDRLIIQKCIDDNNLKSSVSYNSNIVYPFKRIVKAYRNLQKNDSLSKLSKEMYNFFINACGDIAHYNIDGFKANYNYSMRNLEYNHLKHYIYYSNRFSDRNKIFKCLKIGEYFEERKYIDVNNISLNKFKALAKKCGWSLTIEKKLYKFKEIRKYDDGYTFEINLEKNKISDIINGIIKYSIEFDKEDYIENLVENRERLDKVLSISEIVNKGNYINNSLKKFASDIVYNCRVESEILNDFKDSNKKDYDLDLELEM